MAWCATQFPGSLKRTVECCGCFTTPHYLSNLVHVDFCNTFYPATNFTLRDFKTLDVNCPNSTAYSALQSSKSDFMKTTFACPNHFQKTLKTVREASPLKFIPPFKDFGSSSDSDTLHNSFKESLLHIKGAQEKHIESCLENNANGKVLDVAKAAASRYY